MPVRWRFSTVGLVVAVASWACCGASAQEGPRTVLRHAFGQASDAATPSGSLTSDVGGNLYGVSFAGGSYGLGAVFEISPPSVAGGQWTEAVLYSFPGGSSGAFPRAPLLIDSQGSLYGVTGRGGGNFGTVFKLSPPAAAERAWDFTVVHAFEGGNDGAYPAAGLAVAANALLYGTTFEGGANNQGTVYELTPPALPGDSWSETVIHSFSASVDGVGPGAPLLADAQGRLYGTTGTGPATALGSVFALSPPAAAGSAWTETLLHSFTGSSDGSQPVGGLIADAVGNLYGVTFGGGVSGFGTVFELSPPLAAAAPWTRTTLHDFAAAFAPGPDGGQPLDGVTMDADGNLYGTTSAGGPAGHGTVFRLDPPDNAGGVWTQTILTGFSGSRNGRTPLGSVVVGANGHLFGTTGYYGAYDGGTAFEVVP